MDAEMITNPFMVLLKSLLLVFLLIPKGIKVRFDHHSFAIHRKLYKS